MNACEQGNTDVIKVIVEQAGSPVLEFKSISGSPLHAAISCESTAIQQGDDTVELEGGLKAF